MNGQELVSRMKRLGEVHSIKDVGPLSRAMFPGPHCPLMGAMMAVRGIKDSVMLVVGTDECTYYTKNTTIGNKAFGGLDGRCLSVVLDQHDVTFGCKEKLYDAFQEMMEEYKPRAVFVVTTCVVEVIGDDVDSMVEELKNQYGVYAMAVHTEHFKTENHLPGVRDTITACFDMMTPRPDTGAVNIIGQRMGDFTTTELYACRRRCSHGHDAAQRHDGRGDRKSGGGQGQRSGQSHRFAVGGKNEVRLWNPLCSF